MSKKTTQAAVEKFIAKQCAPQNSREPKRRNKKPERQTETDCLLWCRANNMFVHVIESSSYDHILGRKTLSKTTVGMPDLIGNTINGNSVYIELKAKDRRSTLKDHQRAFLIEKIRQNCFAVVVDSVHKLDQYYKEFCKLRNQESRQTYLLDCLPRKINRSFKARDEFEKKHGF